MTGRARLSQADYVSAAFEVSDGIGLHALTLKSLGRHLGVDSTAVYRHFRSKDVLLLAMLDRLLVDELPSPGEHADPRAELEHIVRSLRTVLVANPPLAVALAGVPEPPDSSVRLTLRIVDALSRLGLQGDELVVHYQLLEHFVLGACVFDGDGSPDDWDVRRRRYARIGSSDFRDAASSPERARQTAEAAFATGLRLVLDSCQSAAGESVPA